MKIEFQVEQSYGKGGKGWEYFSGDFASIDEIEDMAIKTIKDAWDKQYKPASPSILFNPQPCRPTIHVFEFKDGKKVKGGIRFKTKWR